MQFVSCGKGHYYNPAENATCPQCARESAGQTGFDFGVTQPLDQTQPMTVNEAYYPPVPSGGGMDPIGATEPIGSFGGGTPTMPVSGGNGGSTIPAPGGGGAPGNTIPAPGGIITTGSFGNPQPAGKIQDYGPTTPVGPIFDPGVPGAPAAQIKPVVGWLVCIEGPSKGRDFRIHSQNNYVGRARHMDICIEGDNAISSERAAIVAYDNEQKMFYFAPGMGSNLLRHNGKAIFAAVELQAYDALTIGKSKFLFIPLCGERFDWSANEEQNETK